LPQQNVEKSCGSHPKPMDHHAMDTVLSCSPNWSIGFSTNQEITFDILSSKMEIARKSTPFLSVIDVSERLNILWDIFSDEDKVLILINADPDSIASALALRRLLWRRVHSSAIVCINVVRRPDNLAMIRLLKVPLLNFETIDPVQFTKKAIVDSQPPHHEIFSRFQYDVVIDHHPVNKGFKASFIDIHPEYGANASLMTEYLRAAQIRPSGTLATALSCAIKAETLDFERGASEGDVAAFRYLFSYANKNLVRKIESSEMTLEAIPYYKLALNEMRVNRNKKMISVHLGKVINPDICVIIADFFMRIHDVSWSIVSGIYGGKFIIILRSDGYRKDAGKLAAMAFGPFGYAGGHKVMARAEIPVKTLKVVLKNVDPETLSRFVRRRVAGKPQSQ